MPHFFAVALAWMFYKFIGFIISEVRKRFCSNNDDALPDQSSGNVVAGLNLKVDLAKRNSKYRNINNVSNPYKNGKYLDYRTKRLYELWLGINPGEYDDYFRKNEIIIINVQKS